MGRQRSCCHSFFQYEEDEVQVILLILFVRYGECFVLAIHKLYSPVQLLEPSRPFHWLQRQDGSRHRRVPEKNQTNHLPQSRSSCFQMETRKNYMSSNQRSGQSRIHFLCSPEVPPPQAEHRPRRRRPKSQTDTHGLVLSSFFRLGTSYIHLTRDSNCLSTQKPEQCQGRNHNLVIPRQAESRQRITRSNGRIHNSHPIRSSSFPLGTRNSTSSQTPWTRPA